MLYARPQDQAFKVSFKLYGILQNNIEAMYSMHANLFFSTIRVIPFAQVKVLVNYGLYLLY